jgi:pyridoxine 4-oxidase
MRHFDVLIIGGGSAGSVLASRFSEDACCQVALLEAGDWPDDPDIAKPEMWPLLQGRDYDWQYATLPQSGTADRIHAWPRGRVVGGSSCLHAMAHVRGHQDDFAAWAQVSGDANWSWQGLLPYFIKSERFSGGASAFHGDSGPLDVWLPDEEIHPLVKSYMQAGLNQGVPWLGDHNGGTLCGVAPNSLTIRRGQRVSAADAWLTPARDRSNLTLFLHSQVEKLLIEGNKITGVACTVKGEARTFSASTVILAAGALASPALLMRSGLGKACELEALGISCKIPLEKVGKNLHDHLLAAGNVWLARQPIAKTRLQHSESLMYLNSADITLADAQPDIVLGCVCAPSVAESFPQPAPGTTYTLLCGVTRPTSRGEIRLTGPDIRDKLLIDPAYLQTEYDRQTFLKALKIARRIGNDRALSPWRESEWLPGEDMQDEATLNAFLARAVITHHHPVGTCQMGKTDKESVVDSRLKIHGLDNGYIVDASVIPSITSGPVHAAVLAIAESFAARL